MKCEDVTNKLWDQWGDEEGSFIDKVMITLHLARCPRCAEEARRLGFLRGFLGGAFFPPAPSLPVMELLPWDEVCGEAWEEGGVSTRRWVLTGCFVLLSLGSAFFGMDFVRVAGFHGASFLVPVGITVGVVLTCYGALFIASHLEEFSVRFNLR